MKIIMSEDISLCRLAKIKEDRANDLLLSFVIENEELIANLAHKKLNKGEEVERISVRASVKLGDYCFHDAEVKVSKVSILRRIYLTVLKMLKMIDYKEVPCSGTICGIAIIFTLRVVVFK